VEQVGFAFRLPEDRRSSIFNIIQTHLRDGKSCPYRLLRAQGPGHRWWSRQRIGTGPLPCETHHNQGHTYANTAMAHRGSWFAHACGMCDHRSGIAHADCRSLGLCARRHHAQPYAVERHQYLLQSDDSQGAPRLCSGDGDGKGHSLGLDESAKLLQGDHHRWGY
jgi:hypothetical protein